jgi:hypothetical protein
MVTTLGIKINEDEARVLLASADSNGDNLLAVDEFIELIFSRNDAINIDLSKIPKEDLVVEQGKEQQFIDDFRKDAESQRYFKNLGQLHYFIQNSLQSISMGCLDLDIDRNYYMKKDEFMNILNKKLRLPDSMKTQAN